MEKQLEDFKLEFEKKIDEKIKKAVNIAVDKLVFAKTCQFNLLLVAINAYILIKLRIGYTNYAYMMLPYFLWLCFALYLNMMIVLLN